MRELVKCQQCGNDFSRSRKNQKYCSRQCRWDFNNRIKLDAYQIEKESYYYHPDISIFGYIRRRITDILRSRHHFTSNFEGRSREFVYLMREDKHGLYKVGKSISPTSRVDQLHNLPYELIKIIHVIPTDNMARLESDFHKLYAGNMVSNEWFDLFNWQVEFFCAHKEILYHEKDM